MKHRLTSIDNILRGVLFGGLLATVAAIIALVLANGNGTQHPARAGDPAYTPTTSEVLPQPVRTDVPAAMLPVPVETVQAQATSWAKYAPHATETAVAEATRQAEFGPYASQTALVIPAATVPQPDVPSKEPIPQT